MNRPSWAAAPITPPEYFPREASPFARQKNTGMSLYGKLEYNIQYAWVFTKLDCLAAKLEILPAEYLP